MTGARVRGRPRSERAREAVLAAAGELVLEVGYAQLSVEGIAARAGVGKQTIYRWWPSKGAVVFDALLAMSEGEHGLALPDSGDVARDLRAVVRAIVAELKDARLGAVFRAVTAEVQDDSALAAELIRRLLGPQLRATRERLESAQRAGQVAADADLDVGVELLFGPVFHRWLLRTAPLSAAHADRVVALALAALRSQ